MTGTTASVLAVLGARPASPRLRVTCEAAIKRVPCGLKRPRNPDGAR